MTPQNPQTPRAFLQGSRQHSAWFAPLSNTEPVAEGRESKVFERPGKASQLIKVPREEVVESLKASRAIKHRLRRLSGVGPYKIFLRHGKAYRDAILRAAYLGYPPPIAHPRGILLTDLGLGLIVQKIRDREGNLAPTLRQLARAGRIDTNTIRALTRFAHEIREFRIITTDLNPTNLVYETRHERSRIVLIDGYGSRALIPLRRWSRRINDRRLAQQLQILADRIGINWDYQDWSFYS